VGAYAEIARAYQALTLWMQEHGHESAGAPCESYLVGPGQVPDPAEYRSEILWPIHP
jgi:effector-binding domain-containing protein